MIDALLKRAYGFREVTLTPAPRGFVAETYYVETERGRYFAKIINMSVYSLNVERGLPALTELRQHGVEHLIYPIPTTDGHLSVRFDDKIFILFNFVPGSWVFDYPLEPYVRLLAQVHKLSAQIQTPLPREQFSDFAFTPGLLRHLDQTWNESFDHPHEKALQNLMVEHRAEIERDYAIFLQTAAKLESHPPAEFILTHGDAPGNILYDGTTLYLVDWDDVTFAPRERDTWFHFRTPGFLAAYREQVPGYEFDPVAYRFYLYKRYFEDLEGYLDNILSADSSDEKKAKNYDELIKTCFEWLRPLMDESCNVHGCQ